MSTKLDEMLKISIFSDGNFDLYKSLFSKRVDIEPFPVQRRVSYLKRVIKSNTFLLKNQSVDIDKPVHDYFQLPLSLISQVKILKRLSILASYKIEVSPEHRAV